MLTLPVFIHGLCILHLFVESGVPLALFFVVFTSYFPMTAVVWGTFPLIQKYTVGFPIVILAAWLSSDPHCGHPQGEPSEREEGLDLPFIFHPGLTPFWKFLALVWFPEISASYFFSILFRIYSCYLWDVQFIIRSLLLHIRNIWNKKPLILKNSS